MQHVTHGGKSAQVTDEFSHLESDVRTEHIQRNLTRYIDKFLAEEGIANKGPGSRIVVRRAFESTSLWIRVDLIAGYTPPACEPPNHERSKHHHHNGPLMPFKDLKVGDKFYMVPCNVGPEWSATIKNYRDGGSHVHLKITDIVSGTPPYTGTANNVDTWTGTVSGCGDEVQVYRIHEDICTQ